jgi:hypothetical protein
VLFEKGFFQHSVFLIIANFLTDGFVFSGFCQHRFNLLTGVLYTLQAVSDPMFPGTVDETVGTLFVGIATRTFHFRGWNHPVPPSQVMPQFGHLLQFFFGISIEAGTIGTIITA